MIFDTVGKAGLGRSLKSLKRGGYYLVVSGVGRKTMLGDVFVGTIVQIWGRITGAVKLIGMPKQGGLANVIFLKELIEAGKVRTVIERRYRLEDISAAHRHAEGGHKKGHVLITFD
jgi:NADPH:quinone reductase-like Zn-dependent oxidoreductase